MSYQVEEIYLGVIKNKDGSLFYKKAPTKYGAAIGCFTDNLIKLDESSWQNHTECIFLYKVFKMKDTMFGFDPEIISYSPNMGWTIPACSDMRKEGGALISIQCPQKQSEPFSYKVEFMETKRTINDITAN
tara:strand:+ start:6016 stop:6408 length:393 start_codon:yes stop_codon:yes gene_type:complete